MFPTASPVQLIASACERIRNQLRGSRGRWCQHPTTPSTQKYAWYQGLDRECAQEPNVAPYIRIKRVIYSQWADSWAKHRDKVPPDKRVAAFARRDILENLHLHDNLLKAESSLATQLRTEKIGFNAFLARQGVPGVIPNCFCGHSSQTVKHIMLFCPSLDRSGQQLGSSSDLNTILSDTNSLKKAVGWLISLNMLPQFRLAKEPMWNSVANSETPISSSPSPSI